MILRLVDRLSGPAKRAQAAVKGLAGAQGLERLQRAGQAASKGLGVAERGAGRMGGAMARAKAKVDALALKSLPMLNRMAERAGYGMGSLIRKAGGLALGAAKWGAAGLATAAGAGAGLFASGIIGKGAQFEQFQVMLENAEGSAEKAKKAMGWVQQFAAKTPYELEQVMQAFVQLKAYGIDPMDGSLKSLGNASAGMSKDIMQAVEMMADAQTGEFERLKEFGVRAKVQGDKVTFTYMKAGKEISRTAKNSAAEIKGALTGIFDERFGGMMDRQAGTLKGIWSNMMDWVARQQLRVGNAGFLDKLKSKASALMERLNRMEVDGTMDRWADRISDKLEGLIDRADQFVTGTDWNAAANGMMVIGDAAMQVLTTVGKIAAEIGWLIDKMNAIDSYADGWDDRASVWMRDRGMDGLAGIHEMLNNALGGTAGRGKASQEAAKRRARGARGQTKNIPASEWGAIPGWAKPGSAQNSWPSRGLKVGSAAPLDVRNKVEVAIVQPAGMLTSVKAQPGAGGSLTVTRKVNRGWSMAPASGWPA